ncbi:MAG: integrase [Methanosphaera stadtmanae]|nr:integrase [Methanosphaera stadtmanae]
MYNNELFIKFCKDRNIRESTKQGYVSTLTRYTNFHDCSIEELICEAEEDEKNRIPLKERRLKKRLLDYRTFLLESDLSSNTVKTYFSKLKTFYVHHEIEIPHLPDVKYDVDYEINYMDLPTKDNIRDALDISPLPFKALILFMSSSGTAKAETLSLSVGDFINGCGEYFKGRKLDIILEELSGRSDIVPTIYLKRIKTDKFYYTFCSSEASEFIVRYLRTRRNLKLSDKLFPFKGYSVTKRFQMINDRMGWGVKGNYRFFRTHTLRKFHASNIQLAAEYVDALQGRSKNIIHETYIKTNPDKLKEIYVRNMRNVMIYDNQSAVKHDISEDIHITINVFLSEQQINLY